MNIARTFLFACVLGLAACNQESETTVYKNDVDTTANKPEPKTEMKQYWLTLLLKGPSRTQDSAASAKIQAAHMANIDRLAAEEKIVMAGPMGYDKDLRGIFIIDAPDSATAASYIKTDSAVLTGRLRFEVHPWWTAKGNYTFK